VFTSLLCSEYPASKLLSTVNSAILVEPSRLSFPCRARLNCQSSTELSHSATNYILLHFTQLNCTQLAWGPRYIASGRIQQKTPPPNSSSIFVMGCCLAIAKILLTRLPTVTKQYMILLGTCYVAPSSRLFVPNSLQSYRYFCYPRAVFTTSVLGFTFLSVARFSRGYYSPTAPCNSC
jgi:hypothetical protein